MLDGEEIARSRSPLVADPIVAPRLPRLYLAALPAAASQGQRVVRSEQPRALVAGGALAGLVLLAGWLRVPRTRRALHGVLAALRCGLWRSVLK